MGSGASKLGIAEVDDHIDIFDAICHENRLDFDGQSLPLRRRDFMRLVKAVDEHKLVRTERVFLGNDVYGPIFVGKGNVDEFSP